VFPHGEPPEAVYSFKHALVQDAAYESLLKSRRQVLHRRIVEVLCDRFPVLAEKEPAVVAHHFAQGDLLRCNSSPRPIYISRSLIGINAGCFGGEKVTS